MLVPPSLPPPMKILLKLLEASRNLDKELLKLQEISSSDAWLLETYKELRLMGFDHRSLLSGTEIQQSQRRHG